MAFRPEMRGWLVAASVIAGFAGQQGLAEGGNTPQQLIEQAQHDLSRGDGVAAEFRIKDALAAGAKRQDVAAIMGEAQMAQGRLGAARDWLGKGEFVPQDAVRGHRALAQLERAEGNLKQAGLALDVAMKIRPGDADLWVDIGRLRYAGGEQFLAIDAMERALKLGPRSVRALEFKAQLTRDSAGLAASLPWFERALHVEPQNFGVLGDYAATLGDLGRYRQMLAICKRMLKIAPNNPKPYYLLAVLAARGGDNSLARTVLNKGGEGMQNVPGVILLDAMIHLRDGNLQLALAGFERVLKAQPGNQRVHRLRALALFQSQDDSGLIASYGTIAERNDSSPWLQALMAKAYERQGNMRKAAALRRMSVNPNRPDWKPVLPGSPVGDRIAAGDIAGAQAMVEASLAASSGFAPFHALAGDVALAKGNGASALESYSRAARVRATPVMAAKIALAQHMVRAR